MCNAVFGKTMQNVRPEKDIKLVTANFQRNKLVSQPNYHCTKWFSEDLLAIEMRKIKVNMNKPIYLAMSILDISKLPMYEFWYDYLKPKYKENLKLCYMDTDSFTFNVKTAEWCISNCTAFQDISNDIEQRFDASKQANIPIKKALGIMKHELGGHLMKEFIGLRSKFRVYLTDDGKIGKIAKEVKKCVTKKSLRFNDYKDCLMNKKK